MSGERQGLTPIGKLVVFLFVAGLLAAGAWLLRPMLLGPSSSTSPTSSPSTASTSTGTQPAPATSGGTTSTAPAATAVVVEPLRSAPRLAPPQPYEPRDGVVDLELSEYAGYAGLIVANGGLEPSESSHFFRRHGMKVRIRLSEEESWSALNAGRMAASATTVDVLAAYGRPFQVVVPAQIGFSRGADGVVVDSDLRRVNALRGRTLAASQFTEADFFLRYLAQEAGVPVAVKPSLDTATDPERINLVYTTDAFAAGDLYLAELAGTRRLQGCVTWAPKTGEVAEASAGKSHVLITNTNLLIVADVLVVNKGFAEKHPDSVLALVEGLLEGNRQVRADPTPHLPTIARAFGWTPEEAKDELTRVHLSNLPENAAFFSGAIDAAGSYGSIFQSAILAYGKELIPDPVDGDRFLDRRHLESLVKANAFPGEKVLIQPIRSGQSSPLEGDPLLSKDIRFFFQPNSAKLDLEQPKNLEDLKAIDRLLRVSPGSTVLLRGHVDDAMVPEFKKQGGEAFVRQMALKAVELSKNRALEIRNLLIERHKVEPQRLEAVGRGWDEPVSKVSDDNRRVEVQWFTVE